MKKQQLPWSFYSILVTFAIFFGCLNIYILTLWLNHPLASIFWLVGAMIGLILLAYSIRLMRVHQSELIEKKRGIKSPSDVSVS